MHQRHSDVHAAVDSHNLGSQLAFLLDLHVSMGCCNHDCHNALKWALRAQDDFGESCKALFLVLETLRFCFHYILETLPDFLQHRLRPREEDPDDPDAVRQYWHAMGVSADTANALTDWNLWWDGEVLWFTIQTETPSDLDVVHEVSQLLLEVFHFRRCTASRWCSLGVSCRVLMASLGLGLAQIMHMILLKPHTNEHYSHNWHNSCPLELCRHHCPGLLPCGGGSRREQALMPGLTFSALRSCMPHWSLRLSSMRRSSGCCARSRGHCPQARCKNSSKALLRRTSTPLALQLRSKH